MDHERHWAYILAERLGHTDVDAMLDTMTPEQWTEWKAYLSGPDNGGNR